MDVLDKARKRASFDVRTTARRLTLAAKLNQLALNYLAWVTEL